MRLSGQNIKVYFLDVNGGSQLAYTTDNTIFINLGTFVSDVKQSRYEMSGLESIKDLFEVRKIDPKIYEAVIPKLVEKKFSDKRLSWELPYMNLRMYGTG